MIIKIEVPKELEKRVLDAFASLHGYQETVIAPNSVDMLPNPEGKAEFMTRLLNEFVMQDVKRYEGDAAADVARKAAHEKVASEVTIVSKAEA
jgi:hypothetical protein